MEEHDATATVGFDEQDSSGFQNTAHLVARPLVHLARPFGLQTLEGG